jgi:uncharacterized membrane protein
MLTGSRRSDDMKKMEIFTLAIIALSFLIGVVMHPLMPDSMASHWDMQGNVNGYMPKFWGIFLMPVLSLVMLLIFMTIPKIDPMRKNVAKFRNYFDMFVMVIILFLFYIYLLTLLWNFGLTFSISRFLIPAFTGLFYYMGVLLEKTKRNWFIGIRTPWTISSEKVWNKTHKLGGKLFKATAIVILLGLFFERIAFLLVIIPIIVVTAYTFAYSYIEYQRQRKR